MNPHQQASLDVVNGTSAPPSGGAGLASLLPTAGSILGGIGGAFIPGLGETGLGEAGGSAAGGAAGKWLENQITGQKGGELGAAVEGGVGAGVGSVLGKVGSAVGRGALGKIASATAPKAAIEAAPVAGAAEAAYRQPFEEALTSNMGRQHLSESANFADRAQTMQGMGVENTPGAWKNFGELQSGKAVEGENPGNAAITSHLRNIVKGSGDIPEGDLMTQVYKTVGFPNTSTIEPGENSAIKNITNIISKSQKIGPDNVTMSTPEGLMDAIQELDDRFWSNPIHKGTAASPVIGTPQNQAEISMIPRVKSLLEDQLYNRAGVDEKVAAFKLNTTQEQAIRDSAKSKGLPDQAAQDTIDKINNAQTGQDMRSAQKQAVDISRMGKETGLYQQGAKATSTESKAVGAAQAQADKDAAAATAEQNKPGAGSAALGALGHAVTGNPKGALVSGAKAGIQAAGGAKDAVHQGAEKLAASEILKKRTAMATGGGAGGAVGGLLGLAGQPGATGGGAPSANLTAQGGQEGGGVNPLQQAFQGDINAQNALVPNAMKMGDSGFASAAAGMGANAAGLAPQLQGQQQAATVLGSIPGAYGQTPTGLAGGLESLLPWTQAHAYNQQKLAAAAALAKALGITPEQAQGILPQIMTPGAAPGREQMMGGILSNLGAGAPAAQ